jgi:hypothetical protein
MSILEQISEHGYRHLRGAVPNSDWTGIEEHAVWISDKQYRYPNKDGSKSEHYRSLGTTLKLTADGKDWQLWIKRVRERLKENGFTTMSYVRDPLKSEPYEPHDMRGASLMIFISMKGSQSGSSWQNSKQRGTNMIKLTTGRP